MTPGQIASYKAACAEYGPVANAPAAELTPDERRQAQQLQAHRVLMLLMDRVPLQLPFTNWTISRDGIRAMYSQHQQGAPEPRGAMRRLAAEMLGFEHAVRTHDAQADKISVVGEIEGIRCELWVLVDRCACDCHEGGAR